MKFNIKRCLIKLHIFYYIIFMANLNVCSANVWIYFHFCYFNADSYHCMEHVAKKTKDIFLPFKVLFFFSEEWEYARAENIDLNEDTKRYFYLLYPNIFWRN